MINIKNHKKCLLLYLLATFLYSCHDQTKRNQNWIVGEWSSVEDITVIKSNDGLDYWDMRNFNLTGYHFMENGTCENKIGYYAYYDPEDPLSLPYRRYYSGETKFGKTNWLNNVIRFFGNNTSYQVGHDNLKIYNPVSKKWDTKKISFLSRDTMLLLSVNDTLSEKYVRRTYSIDNEPLFDQIIFYCPNTYFAPSRFFSIQRNGSFICSGCFTGKIDDIFIGKIEKEEFERLELLFKKADFYKILDEVYNTKSLNADSRFDQFNLYPQLFCPYVSFISKDRLYTIENPLGDIFFENKEFAWACFAGLFFPEQAHFIPETLEKQERLFSEFDSFRSLTLEKQDSIIDLYDIERFYLNILLSQAKVSNEKFQPVYTLKESLEAKEKIETDGRYFSYMKNGEKIILDIGFNVVKENNLDKLFRGKTYGEWSISNDIEFVSKKVK